MQLNRALGEIGRAAAAAACAMLLQSCGAQAPATAPPPAPVEIVTVALQPVANAVELPGRVEAVRAVEVRARVDGIVERRFFTEGEDLKAGTPLFQIDPRDTRAQLQAAQAALARAQASRNNAASISGRFGALVGEEAISALEYDTAQTNLRQAEAAVSEARAAVDRAQLRLDDTTVRAPIGGRVGRALVSEGALVSAAQATLMTQVDELSPVYVVFTKSSSDIMDLTERVRAGAISLPLMENIQVRLLRDNGQDYGVVGRINFTDLSVQSSTGSQIIRAEFPNPQRNLLPGQFVRGVIMAGTIRDGVSIPERAVQIGAEEASVMVVVDDDIVARRIVTLGGRSGGQWTIRSGLKAGERVIVDGWQRVQPGQKVTPRPAGQRPAAGVAGGGK